MCNTVNFSPVISYHQWWWDKRRPIVLSSDYVFSLGRKKKYWRIWEREVPNKTFTQCKIMTWISVKLSHMPQISRPRKFKMLGESWNVFLYQPGNFWKVLFGWFVNCSKRGGVTTLRKLLQFGVPTSCYRHIRISAGTNGWDTIPQHLQALSISWLL